VVSFDALSDSRFMSSLQDMGLEACLDVLDELDSIAERRYSWQQFVNLCKWQTLNLSGQDTFPGANDLHQFLVQGVSGQSYTVVGYTHNNVIVVCAIARKV
jgi:hypothetical protein